MTARHPSVQPLGHPGGRPPLLPLDVVHLIHAMAGAGYTNPQISAALNAADIPPPTGKGLWTRTHVWRQLRTARYTAISNAA